MIIRKIKMKRFMAAGVLALCLMASQIARADENRNAQIKAEMVQNYLLFEVAFMNKDAERMISFESPDYTSLTEDKSIYGKEESDRKWHDVMNSFEKVFSARAEIKRMAIEANRVVVVTNQQVDCLRQWHDTKLSRVLYSSYVRDIWVNYDGVWMLKRSEDSRTQIIVDGKRVK